jgi:hypothetical protein
MRTKIHDSAVGLNVWRKWHTCKTKKTIILLKVIKFCHNGSNNKIRITNWLRKLSRVTKIIQSTEKIEVCETDKSGNQQPKLKQVFPDTDRSSTLQKSFSNQNSRQRSLASNSSNNVYRKRPFSGLHKKNSPFQGYTNISENLFQFWLLIPVFVFHRLRFFFVLCIIFVTLDSFFGDRYFVVTCYYIGWVNQ